MLKIWGRTTSSNVQKVLWCCAELGIEYDRVDLGGPFGGNQDPEYLALNPNGLVPTVKDGDLILWESNTICRYLCTTRDGERLYPTAPAARTTLAASIADTPRVTASSVITTRSPGSSAPAMRPPPP